MSGVPFMKLYIGDLMGDTNTLNAKQFGAYMLILISLWKSKDGNLPIKLVKFASRCGRDWPNVWEVIRDYFIVDDAGMVSQERVLRERGTVKPAVISQQSVRVKSGITCAESVRVKSPKSLKTNNPAPENSENPSRARVRCQKSETLPSDTSYPQSESMPGCSAAASQPPPTSAEAGAAPPAPARDASACAPPRDAPPPARVSIPSEDQAKIDSAQIAMAVGVFNKIAADVGWPAVKPPLSAVRASKLRARIKRAGGIAGWLAQMRRAAASDFLTGKSESGWKASFDFFSQESSFDRLIEGNYDNSTKQPAKHDRGSEGARRADRPAGSRDQRDSGGPHRGLLAGFAQASQRLDPDPDDARNGGDDPALG